MRQGRVQAKGGEEVLDMAANGLLHARSRRGGGSVCVRAHVGGDNWTLGWFPVKNGLHGGVCEAAGWCARGRRKGVADLVHYFFLMFDIKI